MYMIIYIYIYIELGGHCPQCPSPPQQYKSQMVIVKTQMEK